MPSPRDERLADFRALRAQVREHPENFAAFLGELHAFLKDLYEAGARADGKSEGFIQALMDLCKRRGLEGWEDFLATHEREHFFRDARDAQARRIIDFWSELDRPLDL